MVLYASTTFRGFCCMQPTKISSIKKGSFNMEYFKYITTDERTVFSPVSLSYALSSNHLLNLSKVSAADQPKISIIADNCLSTLLHSVTSGKSPWETKANEPVTENWLYHNYCAMVGDRIHIRDGKTYKTLTAFMDSADPDELKYALTMAAMQAALCRTELLQQAAEKVVAV